MENSGDRSRSGVQGRPAEGVGDDIGGARHMTDVGSEFSDEREMAGLAWRSVGEARQGATERLVVREDCEGPALQDMAKMFDGHENCEKLPIESAILFLRVTELLGEEGDRPVVGLR